MCAEALREPRIKLLRLSRNFGQHPAITAALVHARADAYILMDADLQDPPEEIPTLVRALSEKDVDIVYSQKIGAVSDGLFRRLTSLLFHRLVARESNGLRISDVGTFRAFSELVASALRLHCEQSVVYGPLMQSMGFSTVVVPIERVKRSVGRSSYTFSRRLDLALQSLISYSRIPQRIFFGFGGAVVLLAAVYLVVVVCQYVVFGARLPPGMTLLLVLAIGVMGVILSAFGFVAAYLFAIHREVLGRPRYIIWQKVNVDD